MSLNIIFTDDIVNALQAANEATTATARVCDDSPTLRAYLEGYHAALATVALAFGLSPTTIGHREIVEVQAAMVEEPSGLRIPSL